MSQTSDQPEEKKVPEPAQATPAAENPAMTGNLAFTNPDEYKHKHGEHKDGEHHHHHHHHHHQHRHFHILNLSPSGILENLKLLFKSIYAYPYIFLFLSLIFLFVMNSGVVLSQLNAHKGSFSDVEMFYRWQEYLVMNKAVLIRIPFQITLVVAVGILIFLMQQKERHWQRNVMKLLPALAAAAIFSIPMGGGKTAEEYAQSACRDCLTNYYNICMKFASRHDGAFPKRLPHTPSAASKYSSDHFIYHGSGKKVNDELFIMIEDKQNNHIGNYRYALRNDGMILVSKYGGLYEKYKSAVVQKQTEDEEDEEDEFEDMNEDIGAYLKKTGKEKISIVEGTIEERSILPDPKRSDYPNCRFTAHFIGNTIISGQACPKELLLSIEGFANYAALGNDRIKAGDRVLCSLIPFDQLPEDEQTTQQADDLELYLLDNYYVLDIKIIDSFTDNEQIPSSGILFSDGNDDYISIFDRHINPPISQDLKQLQEASIQKDLEKMNSLLDGYDETKIKELNRQFAEAWKKEQEKDAPEHNRVGDFVWRNIDNSFWTLPKNYTLLQTPTELSQGILDCFSSLKKALEENGVQLIVSLVPDLYVVSSRVINKEFKDIPDIQTATYVKQLSEIGVETIYASDSILRNYHKYPFAFFYPSNEHPSDTTQDVLSDILAERLKRYNVSRNLNPQLFLERQSPHAYKNMEQYLFPQNCDIGNNKEKTAYSCREILYNGKQIQKTKNSPFLVIGNSFIETPVSPPESLPALLSYKLYSPVDWSRISGFGPFTDIMSRLLSDPAFYLERKKALIMQVGTNHLLLVNQSEIMLNIARVDKDRLILNKKKMKTHFLLSSNTDDKKITDKDLWGPLANSEKTVLEIDRTGYLHYSFDISQKAGISDSKPIICVIPHMCVKNTSCSLTINEQQSNMNAPYYPENAKFFFLAVELPAGTKEINVKFKGKEGSLFAIKDVQIWQ